MSDDLRGVVVAHGQLAEALVHEAEQISGLRGILNAVSNAGRGREEIAQQVEQAVGRGPAVIFVDMPCGSCFFAAMHLARNRPDIRVVTGVNLPMLLDFAHHRELPPADGAERFSEKGHDAIRRQP
jgi:mannose/fructose-specific phosphotransferase system component IIA